MKNGIRMAVDLLMTALLPLLIAYSLIGEQTHEWMGTAMLAAFIAHHILNSHWWKHLKSGSAAAGRSLNTTVDFLLFFDMLMLGTSGMMMSRYVFSFLPFKGGAAFARTMHMLAAYWGFAFMSVHLGLHWRAAWGRLKLFRIYQIPARDGTLRIPQRIRKWIPAGGIGKNSVGKWAAGGILFLVSAYGAYAFIKQGIRSYMVSPDSFAFFDFGEPVVYFLLDYAAVMVLFASCAYYAMEWIHYLCQKKSSKGKK